MTAVGTVGNMPIPVIANGSGTAQAGAVSSLTLNTLASAIADAYKYMQVHILSGTGAGQERNVVSSRKNLLKYSQSFDNAAWTKNVGVTVSPNVAIAPDGTLTADKIIEPATTLEHGLYQNVANAAGMVTVFCYAKAAERNWVQVFDGSGAHRAWFNLATGVVGTVNGGATCSMVPAGNGWYQCIFALSESAGAAYLQCSMATGNGVTSYLGDGTSGLYLWGGQVCPDLVPYIHTEANAAVGVAVDVPWVTQPDATSAYEIYIAGKTPLGVLSQPAFIVGTLTQPTFITGTVGP